MPKIHSTHTSDRAGFIDAQGENHEIFSLVDERCASPLTFDILTDSLLTGIPNSAAEVSIAPICPLFPKRLFQRFFMPLP